MPEALFVVRSSNATYHDYRGTTTKKWDGLRDYFDTMTPVSKDRDDGWSEIELADKTEANRASTSIATYASRINKGGKQGWRLQTSVKVEENCAVLMLRKIRTK